MAIIDEAAFKVDIGVWHHGLEEQLNKRREDGWRLVSLEAMRQPDLYFTIVWFRPPAGVDVPSGFKVL